MKFFIIATFLALPCFAALPPARVALERAEIARFKAKANYKKEQARREREVVATKEKAWLKVVGEINTAVTQGERDVEVFVDPDYRKLFCDRLLKHGYELEFSYDGGQFEASEGGYVCVLTVKWGD